MYCSGHCKYLNSKKHICKLTGEKLTHMRFGSRGFDTKYIVKHNGVCEQDKIEMEERKMGNKIIVIVLGIA